MTHPTTDAEAPPEAVTPLIRGLALLRELTSAHGRESAGTDWLGDLVERRPRGVVLLFRPDSAGRVLASRGIPFVVLDPLDELPAGLL